MSATGAAAHVPAGRTDLPRQEQLPRLHVLTPAGEPDEVLAVVEATLAGRAPCIQLRVKGLTDREHLALAEAVVERCRNAGALCLVNDRVDIALAAGADGVHLGADDLPVGEARRLAAGRLLIGGTARDPGLARRLVDEGADYLGVGPTYATSTKQGLPDPLGVARVAEVAAAVDVPVIAIAGITAQHLDEVLAAGIHGVAVIGAVAAATDPQAATRDLLERIAAATTTGTSTGTA